MDFNGDSANHVFLLPETIEKLMFHSSQPHETISVHSKNSIPADILDTPKEYIFYMDVPGLSKSDIQVTVEEENTLVVRSGGGKGKGKRKREEEGCKYLKMERVGPLKAVRKFRLPENAKAASATAKCENGVLTVVVEKLPPPPKPKTVEVTIS